MSFVIKKYGKIRVGQSAISGVGTLNQHHKEFPKNQIIVIL